MEKVENVFDKLLRTELSKPIPDEDTIRQLVKQGADISGLFLIDAIFCYSQLPAIDGEGERSLDNKYFKLLIELGADVNFEEDGRNSLFEAALVWNPELVKILIEHGANVNCISSDTLESLLSHLIFDLAYETDENRGGAEPVQKIIDIVKQHGAQYTSELFADKVEEYLLIGDSGITGLFTKRGHIKITDIEHYDHSIFSDYKEYRHTIQANWNHIRLEPNKDLFAWESAPDIDRLKRHNEVGLCLAKKLKTNLGKSIKVEYNYVDPDGVKDLHCNVLCIEITGNNEN